MRLLAASLICAAAVTPAVASDAPPRGRAAAVTQHEWLRHDEEAYLDFVARLHPVGGTLLGDHRYDAQLDDLSAAGRAADVAYLESILAARTKATAAGQEALTPDERVDAALLDNALRYRLWQLTTLKDWQWDPQGATETIGGALYGLAARDYAPWPQRLRAATARMNAIPRAMAQMRASLIPARVPPIFATTAAAQNGGVLQVAETMLAPHRGELPRADRTRFDAALARLRVAVAEQQHWLDTVLVPQAKGDFRLGSALYDAKLAFALDGSLTRPEIKARATRAFAETRTQMYAIARAVSPAAGYPASPSAAQQQAAIEAALALTYAKRPARDQLMARATDTLASATAFVRARGLVTLPQAPVRIIEMPKFRQGIAVAYCDAPGPLDRKQGTFYAVSPVPAGWSDAQATSFLSEYNDYMVHDLSIHEAMPGHYLQLAHANANPSTIRAVLSSGPFVEGWAVYAEGMMADEGYLDNDPLFKLTVLKMRLRSITNSLLDIGIHAEGMTEAEAMDLMTRGAFQQEREAAGKWTRARLSSTQLLSYFVGYSEHQALRAEVEAREGKGFDLKRYNDAVLSHGSPPVRYVRALMLGEAIGEAGARSYGL